MKIGTIVIRNVGHLGFCFVPSLFQPGRESHFDCIAHKPAVVASPIRVENRRLVSPDLMLDNLSGERLGSRSAFGLHVAPVGVSVVPSFQSPAWSLSTN